MNEEQVVARSWADMECARIERDAALLIDLMSKMYDAEALKAWETEVAVQVRR